MTHCKASEAKDEIATFPEEKQDSSDFNNNASVPKQSSWIGNVVRVSLAILFLAICIIIVANVGIFGAQPIEPVYSEQFFNIFIDTKLELNLTKEAVRTLQHIFFKFNCNIDQFGFGDTVVENDITHKMDHCELGKLFTNYNLSSVVTRNLEQLGNRSIVITDDPAKYSPSSSVLVLNIAEHAKVEELVHKFLHERVLQVSDWKLGSEIYKKGTLDPAEIVELVFTVKNAHPMEPISKFSTLRVIDEKGKRRSINPRQTFGQDILPGEEIKVAVPIRFNTATNSPKGAISSLPAELHIVAMDDQGENKFYVQGKYTFDTKLLRPMFEDYSGPKAVIYLSGTPGVGKTTFQNLVLFALGYITSFLSIVPDLTNDTQCLSFKTIGNITIVDSFGTVPYLSEQDVIRLAQGGLSNATCLDEKLQKINFTEDSNGPRPNVLFFLYNLKVVDFEGYNTLVRSVIIDNRKSKRAEVALGFTNVNGVSDSKFNSKTEELVSNENIRVRHTEYDPPKRLEYHLDSDGKPTTRMMLDGLNVVVELTYKAANVDPKPFS